jgi:type I restriction enzyme S subunit
MSEPLIDIRPDHLKIVLDILGRQIPDREVWAFGSRVTWKAKDYSDLDLAVISDKPLGYKLLGALKDDFAESDLPFKVDVVDWATTSESFREIIRRDRVVVRGCWLQTTIGEQATLQRGFHITQAQACPGSIPVITPSGTSFSHNIAMAKGPGVIIGRKGSLGTVFYIEGDYWPHDTTLWVKDFHGNDPSFVYYFFKNLSVMHLDVGSANPTLNRNHVHPIPTLWPPLPEQQRITTLLGALDDKIDLNRRMNETLEAMARALFKSWFVDFEPDGSGLTRPPIEQTPSRLSDMIELIGGGTPSTSMVSYWGGDVPWFSVVDAPNSSDVFVISTEKTITQLGLENSSTRILPQYTTIVTARGTVGKLALTACPMTMNQSCYGIRGKSGRPPFFIYFLVRSCIQGLQARTHGSVFDTITRATFDAIEVIDPGVAAAEAFGSAVAPTMSKIRANLEQSRTLSALRDLLLPKLLSGELRIKDAEKAVEAAL